MKVTCKVLRYLKGKYYNFLYKYKKIKYDKFAATHKAITYKICNNLDISIYPEGQIAELLYTSKYEYSEINHVINLLKPNMNVIDVGANIGLYSIIADKIVREKGEVIAFEPSTDNYNRLIKNLELNKTTSVVTCKIALAGIDNEEIALRRDPGLGDGERYLDLQKGEKYKRGDSKNDNGDSEVVQVMTLDTYLHKERDGKFAVDFMKIDVEGSEFDVFRGAQKTLIDNPDIIIFFECAPLTCKRAGHSTKDVYDYLTQLGFGIYCWDEDNKIWVDDPRLLDTIGNVWACRNKEMLPKGAS
jgi:FkbM family methyltransferase